MYWSGMINGAAAGDHHERRSRYHGYYCRLNHFFLQPMLAHQQADTFSFKIVLVPATSKYIKSQQKRIFLFLVFVAD
jgi:hypothetical protein